ncbi:MAG: DUF6364 family protein [Bacteroidota bacterium]
MSSKLPLFIDSSIITKAKIYAEKTGRSLEELVEDYLKRLVAEEEIIEEKVPKEFRDIFGSVKLSSGLDDKQLIRQSAVEKYCE